MIHMLDITLYPSYSIYQTVGVAAYIAAGGFMTYCGLKIHSAIERYRSGKRRNDASELVPDVDEIGTDPELGDSMYKTGWV